MGPHNVGLPMECVTPDILGPLPFSECGNQYLLMVPDYFTKWPEAYTLPNQEATTVAKVFVNEIICRFGVPLEIHFDQGRNLKVHYSKKCIAYWACLIPEQLLYTHNLIGW